MWNVQFYHKKVFVNRSTGCTEFEEAQIRAAQIVLEVARATATPEALEPQPSDAPKTDAGIEHLISLFNEWRVSPFAPGEKRRPRARTAKDYAARLRILAARLKVATLRELAAKVNSAEEPMTASRLGVTEARFVPLVRGAASVFGVRALRYFEKKGLKIDNPFLGHVPQVIRQKPFVPPTKETVSALAVAARSQLSEKHPREHLLFLLCLGAGLRVQEAAFVKWGDVLETGIRASTTSDHENKSNKTRDIPVGDNLLNELEKHRGVPLAYVIPDGATPPTKAQNNVPIGRCYRSARRLAKWLKRHGVRSPNPIHWLRKVFGSRVTEQYDIHTASKWLGHSSIAVTEKTYAGIDPTRRAQVI